jgi:uncharacterized RDD family membrane protein YckC
MNYYFTDGKEKYGPMSLKEAVLKIMDNKEEQSLIWKPGLVEWLNPDSFPEVREMLKELQAPLPSPSPPVQPPEPSLDFEVQPEVETSVPLHMDVAPSLTNEQTEPAQQAHHKISEQEFQRQLDALTAPEKKAEVTIEPQGYAKCPLGKRLLAHIIDGIITSVFVIPPIIIVIFVFSDPTFAIPLLLLALMLIFPSIWYFFMKDSFGQGQSWGKSLMGVMVVVLSTDEPCNKPKAFIRVLVGFFLGIVPYVGWLIEPIIVLAEDKGRRLGDRAADTMVITVDDYIKSRRN